MADLRERLEAAVGETYRIEAELGGGGMSRVFLAEETRLGRKVVIKVLPPEMGAGVNIDRFEREIQLAAKLQHPHIVPLLTAGSEGDLLYYVMPFIEGESLRAKLAREGELPVGEAVRILKEVLDALQYAHAQNVVHRDIKPDNVLLSGKHAVVTDFGVAKAVSASTGESSLTSLGIALGTPAYMAPEQAAADPHVDHRADIYAVGATAYEMLSGRPPFLGHNPQAVLSAHVTQTPDPVTAHRETVPPALNELIMRCLQKKAADRWQRADDMAPILDSMLTPSGGVTPTGTQPVAAFPTDSGATSVAQNHPVRVAAFFGVAAAIVLVVVYGFMTVLGLPGWVLVGAIVLLAVGLPIIFVTGQQERQRAVARNTGLHVETPTGLKQHFTWRKAILGGALAFTGLTVVAGGFMALRAAGIGPAATLVTAGVIDNRERVILADFENRTSDSTLGETVTELFRIDLSQSPTLTVLEPAQVDQILRRMEREPGTRLSATLAQEAAAREGLKAYVTGDVVSLGSGFVVSGRMLATATGEALVSHRENASTADEIVGAVDRLSAKLRERIGESFKTVRSDPPLAEVTTSSMEALRLYAQGSLIGTQTAEYDRGIQLLEQAIELDSTFAMAYRKLAVWRVNASRDGADSAAQRAYDLRSRVGERERWLIEAAYHDYVTDDDEARNNAYLSLLDKYPNDRTAINNLALGYRRAGRRQEASELALRSVRNGGAPSVTYTGLLDDLGDLGRLDQAEEVLQQFKTDFPAHPTLGEYELLLAYNRGNLDAAKQRAEQWRAEVAGNPQYAGAPLSYLAQLAALRGRVAESARLQRAAIELLIDWLGDRVPAAVIENIEMFQHIDGLNARLWYGTGGTVTVDTLESEVRGLRRQLPDTLFPAYPFIELFARVGAVDRAADMLAETRRQDEQSDDPSDPWEWKEEEALVAMAAGDPLGAVRLYHEYRAASPTCNLPTCALFGIGTAFDSAGVADSAIVYFERVLTEPAWDRLDADARQKPVMLRRLGELYETRDPAKAIEYYNRFVDLWADADPELQPVVQEVRRRIARLVGENR